MYGLGDTIKKESPGETEQNAFDAIIELISTKCMKASETELKSDASLVELGAVICQFHPPADPTKDGTSCVCHLKVAHAHERWRGESKNCFR